MVCEDLSEVMKIKIILSLYKVRGRRLLFPFFMAKAIFPHWSGPQDDKPPFCWPMLVLELQV